MTVVINGTTGIDTGTGSLIAADSTTPTYLDLFEDTDNGSNYVRLIAPTSVASNKTITLPDSTGTMVVGSAAVSAVGQIPFSTDGTSYTPTAKIVLGTAITLTNQTAPEFTGIPSWVKRITVMFSGLSTNGTGVPLIQLGDAGGYETSSYLGTINQGGAATPASANFSSGFAFGTAWQATQVTNGIVTLTLIGSNIWTATVLHGASNINAVYYGAGSKTLSETLTSVRLFIDGTQQFDAGTINILYE